MVIYDLKCPMNHQFEGWFRSESDYHKQCNEGLLSCPYCESKEIKKIPSASYINTGRSGVKQQEPTSGGHPVQMSVNPEVMEKLRHFVETQTEDVGREFAEEAKKMHYGEKEQRNIRGEVSIDEMVELHEEGIDAIPLPFPNPSNKKLN